MLTLFDLLKLFGLVLGAAIGGSFGWNSLGIIGGVVGAIAGSICGGLIGQLPLAILLKLVAKKHTRLSSAQLRQQLRDDQCPIPNILLLELRRRGEDISIELPFVHSLLSSPDMHRRITGWAALTSAYPQLTAAVPDYNPTNDTDECCRTSKPLLEYVTEPNGE